MVLRFNPMSSLTSRLNQQTAAAVGPSNVGGEIDSPKQEETALAYVTSRPHVLPNTAQEMRNCFWFNLWIRRLWPYQDLGARNLLYWYESPSGLVRWSSEVHSVERFQYASKEEVGERLRSAFGEFDEEQAYFVDGPEEGYCLAWRAEPLERLNLPRPVGFRFARTGWMKVKDLADRWPELAGEQTGRRPA